MQFRQSNPFVFKTTQFIKRPMAEIFQFFSKAENLERLTPSWLNFKIITPLPIIMEKGAHIDYQLRLMGIPFRWQTEITVWEPPHRFVDEQIIGPYKLWRHEHQFLEEQGATCMRDTVHYDISGSFIRYPIKHFFVGPRIQKIFNFRYEQINRVFPTSDKE
jgi:ligand-binding SRPBCC domain-containing protein